MLTPLPHGLLRLGADLPPEVHPEAALLARLGTAVPAGGVLLQGSDDLGPLAPGGHVSLRVLGSYAAVRVPTDSPAVLAAGLRAARLATPAGARQDVLVLRAVASVHAGRVVLADGPDEVRAVEGEAHELDGAGDVRALLLPRLSPWERPHRGVDRWRTPLPPWAVRLAKQVRRAHRVVGTGELTWADDGRACRLLGVRSTP